MATLPRPLGAHGRTLPLPPGVARANWWVIAAIMLAGMSALLPVLQNSSATSRGFRVQSLQARQAELNGQIGELESEVARLTSQDRIERRARAIGLEPSSNPIFITVDVPGPAPAKIPAELLPSPQPRAAGAEPWWRSLFRWLPLPD
ncbi:MAG: septum formation initiator family protein [Chloroflexi bacterium]|nr:septum formation initiator family protein [Chloroflexota bacterium]